MEKIVALIYWVFKTDRKQTTPYFATCLIVTLLFVINLASVAALLNVSSELISFNLHKDEKWNRWLNTIILGTSLWIMFIIIFSRNKLESYQFNDYQIAKARKKLVTYIIISIFIMLVTLMRLGIQKGLIKI